MKKGHKKLVDRVQLYLDSRAICQIRGAYVDTVRGNPLTIHDLKAFIGFMRKSVPANKTAALLEASKALLEECGHYSDDIERHDCEFLNTSSEGKDLLEAIQAIDETYGLAKYYVWPNEDVELAEDYDQLEDFDRVKSDDYQTVAAFDEDHAVRVAK